MKIILLGASGKVGQGLGRYWSQTNVDFDVSSVFRKPRRLKAARKSDVVWAPGQPLPDFGTVDAVLAFWGVTRGTPDMLEGNVALARSAIDLAEKVGASTAVHCSSAAVYGHGEDWYSETSATLPTTPYGRSKLAMETVITALAKQRNSRVRNIVLRIGNVAGADQLFAAMNRSNRVVLDQFPDGTGPQRSYITIPDIARSLEALLKQEAEGCFNVSAPQPTAMEGILRSSGREFEWRTASEQAVHCVALNVSRLSEVIPLTKNQSCPDYLVSHAQAFG